MSEEFLPHIFDTFERTSTVTGIPVVAMTANAFEEDRTYETGMDGLVTRPLDVGVLSSTLSRVLRPDI